MIFIFRLLASALIMRPIAAVPTITAPTASPVALASEVALPGPTLGPRCDGGSCTFGGSTETLQANTVTTTIVSTTSVPCYVTTYVTDSTTTTETIYSTETVTSTVTEEGTVYVYKYSPVPYLVSSTYKSVLQITQTFTSFWQETSGSAWESTVTGDTKMVGGAVGGGTKSDDSWQSHTDQGDSHNAQAGSGGTVVISTADPTGSAWTHLAADNAGVTTIGADGRPVATGVAAGNGWAAATGGNAVVAAAGGNTVGVNWNGSSVSLQSDWRSSLIVGVAIGMVVVFELFYALV